MNSKIRSLLLCGFLTAILAALLSWLLDINSPPSSVEYSLWYSQMREGWSRLNIPSYIIGAIASGSPHGMNEPVAYTAFFIQWMLIGIIITAILRLFIKLFTQPKPQ